MFYPSGKSKTRESRQSIISPDWNFERMGIGGLDKEFSDIFRRAFASRVFPPDIVEQMGKPPLVLSSRIHLFVSLFPLFILPCLKSDDDLRHLCDEAITGQQKEVRLCQNL